MYSGWYWTPTKYGWSKKKQQELSIAQTESQLKRKLANRCVK